MSNARIMIVGAGPTGLVLALWLAKRGLHPRLIDRAPHPGETSRAIAVQARTLEFYHQMGLADEVVAGGIKMTEIAMRAGGRDIYRAPLGKFGTGFSPFPYALSFPQDDHERLLIEYLRREGVEVERDTELTGLTQSADRVVATLKTPHGSETAEADYLCGCDGASSAVRHALGLGFPGGTYDQVFFVADTDATGEMAAGSINPCLSPDGFCLVIPVRSSGRVRLIGIVSAEHEKQERITWEDVASDVLRYTGLTVSRVHWFSTYHVHHRVADHFRQERVFLAGDAGHVHSPAGGQGMNTGIGDAVNLAWKLAAVVQGRVSSRLLDTYEPERIGFARTLVSTTDWVFQFFVNRSWLGWFLRGTLLPRLFPIATRIPFVQRFLFRAVSQIQISYRTSRLSSGTTGQLRGGDRLPWVPMDLDDNFTPLTSLDWQAHVYGLVRPEVRVWANRMGLPLHSFPWSDHARGAGLQRDAIYLIRPDGYIAHAGGQGDVDRVERVLRDWDVVMESTLS